MMSLRRLSLAASICGSLILVALRMITTSKSRRGCAQLIGLIELLDDFISILAQLFHCASIHPIGNQNS